MSSQIEKSAVRGTMFIQSRTQVSAELAGEAAILQTESGVYYNLSEVGARIWQLLIHPCGVREISAQIAAEYEVEPAACERDVANLLTELHNNGLVQIGDETHA